VVLDFLLMIEMRVKPSTMQELEDRQSEDVTFEKIEKPTSTTTIIKSK